MLLVIKLSIVGNSLAFVQALESVLLDLRKVNKHILAAISRGDEAKALVGEKLDSSLVAHDDAEEVGLDIYKKKRE